MKRGITFVLGPIFALLAAGCSFHQMALEALGQGRLEERRAACTRTGKFFDPVPLSSHLMVHYVVTRDTCYRKEPEGAAPCANTIAVQQLDGGNVIPIIRICNQYHYTDDGWNSFKSNLKRKHWSDYSEVNAETMPLFSSNLRKHIQSGDAVKITSCTEQGVTCYYFTDREWMFFYIKYEDVDEAAVYLDYE